MWLLKTRFDGELVMLFNRSTYHNRASYSNFSSPFIFNAKEKQRGNKHFVNKQLCYSRQNKNFSIIFIAFNKIFSTNQVIYILL